METYYYGPIQHPKTLKRFDGDTFYTLVSEVKALTNNTEINSKQQSLNHLDHNAIYCTIFDKSISDQPLEISMHDYSNEHPMRDFSRVIFKIDSQARLSQLQKIIEENCEFDYIFIKNNANEAELVFPLSQPINKSAITKLNDEFVTYNINLNIEDDQDEFKYVKSRSNDFTIGLPLIKETSRIIDYRVNLSKYNVDDKFIKNNRIATTKKTNKHIEYNDELIKNAIDLMIKDSSTGEIIKDDHKRKVFLGSIAQAQNKHEIDITLGDDNLQVIDYVLESLLPEQSETTLQQKKAFKTEYDDLVAHTKTNSEQIYPSLSESLALYRVNTKAISLGNQLQMTLGDEQVNDTKAELSEVINTIESVYPPVLIQDSNNKDINKLAIYDNLTGCWTKNEDTFYNLLNVVKPASTNKQLETMMRAMASDAANANRVIKAYSGSNYLLFTDGVLDMSEQKFYNLNEPFIRQIHFIERQRLNIPFPGFDAKNPHIPGANIDGSDSWNPKTFFETYTHDDPVLFQYYMFCLSLGLFAGHNFGVHVDLQGESGTGKSQMLEIFKKCFGSERVIDLAFSRLNDQFPFTSYNKDTAIIWLTECNEEADPLNDNAGIPLYDNLADKRVSFQVKGKGDLVIDNPPEVYVDGTQLVKATTMDTGPARRTLVFKYASMTQEKQRRAYSNKIDEMFGNDKVIAWIVSQMINAYCKTVPKSRRTNLKINLKNKNDLAMLPKQAIKWRQELMEQTDNKFDNWFVTYIEPFLNEDINADDSDLSILHFDFLYNLYGYYYKDHSPFKNISQNIEEPDVFAKQLKIIIAQHGWIIKPYGKQGKHDKSPRFNASSIPRINFNIEAYKTEYGNILPEDYKKSNDQLGSPFRRNITGWFTVRKSADVLVKDDNEIKI